MEKKKTARELLKGNYIEASFQLEKAINLNPSDRSLYGPLAEAYDGASNFQKALDNYKIAIQYLEESGNNHVLVGAYDALDEARDALLLGTLQATIDQQAALQGYTGILYAVQILDGETVPMVTILDVLLVTQENAIK